ncbi:MAG: helix-turn-helix domain-containing protein [Salinivirgaceae bacterium]|nr:helix-turn-helix domain-containing protein [Salinivirgaceae bacterium]
MNKNNIHIGNLVKNYVKENHINSAELARKIGKTRQNIYDLYKRDDIEVKLLLAISDALNHNFINDICAQPSSVDDVMDALKQLVKEKIGNKV